MAQGALLRQYIGAGIPIFRFRLETEVNNFMRFAYSWGHRLDCALLGGNGNTLKLKTTAKLNSKQTSIATVPD
jgi:hypothetical protein